MIKSWIDCINCKLQIKQKVKYRHFHRADWQILSVIGVFGHAKKRNYKTGVRVDSAYKEAHAGDHASPPWAYNERSELQAHFIQYYHPLDLIANSAAERKQTDWFRLISMESLLLRFGLCWIIYISLGEKASEWNFSWEGIIAAGLYHRLSVLVICRMMYETASR